MFQIGPNATRLMRLIDKHGSMTLAQLSHELQLGPIEAAMAIGWLARENRIQIERHGGVPKISRLSNMRAHSTSEIYIG